MSKASQSPPTKTGTHQAAAAPPPAKQEIIPAAASSTITTHPTAATLQPAMQALARAVDQTARSYSLALAQATGHLERAFLLADGIGALRRAITPEVMVPIMSLYNSPNGYKCDRPNRNNNSCYSEEVVKECLITALLAGVYPVGNEWNIIASQCYLTANGYKRKLEEISGITDISIVPGAPTPPEAGVVRVRVALSWRLHGIPNSLTDPEGKPGQVFAIATRGGESPDLLIGKAKRRAYKAAFEKATGSVSTVPDGDAGEEMMLGYSGRGEQQQQALPGGSRTQQTQNLFLDKMRQEIGERLAKLHLDEEAWFAISEKLAVPANINTLDQKQAAEVIGWLQVEELRIEDELREEREAMRLG